MKNYFDCSLSIEIKSQEYLCGAHPMMRHGGTIDRWSGEQIIRSYLTPNNNQKEHTLHSINLPLTLNQKPTSYRREPSQNPNENELVMEPLLQMLTSQRINPRSITLLKTPTRCGWNNFYQHIESCLENVCYLGY